jgi:serine/threonine-protein kinase RsbW
MDATHRTVDLRIPSEYGYEKVAMDAASAVARRMGFSEARVEDLRTALAEACLNAMEHGNIFAKDTQVCVILTVADNHLEVDVIDEGRGETMPHVTEPLSLDHQPGLAHGSMGIFLITQLMDEVEFSREAKGSMVKMGIYLEQPRRALAKIGA